jgi:hypothetical protein
VFKNRVLRRIFGPKRDELTGEWRKLHSRKLHNYTQLQILLGRSNQENKVGACSTHGRGEKTVQDGGKARRKETSRKTEV